MTADDFMPQTPNVQGFSQDRIHWPIGVFDSGLGGLTVWRELRKQLPHESFIYLGDTARVPYGGRSAGEIIEFGREIIAWMMTHPVKMMVMACNTSSALALETIRPECPVSLLGLVLPGAQAAVKQGKRIGVLATAATVSSQAFSQAIFENSQLLGKADVQCWEQACPEFVPFIESGRIQSPELRQLAKSYLRPLLQERIDTLIYGCTHYPLLDPVICSLLPHSVRCIDPAVALAEAVARELDVWGLRCNTRKPGSTQFFVSGDPDTFASLAHPWIGSYSSVQQAHLLPVSTQSL